MSALKVFTHAEGGMIAVTIVDGKPWFAARGVARMLGYSDTQAMTRRIDPEDLSTCTDNSSGQARSVSILNESGVYAAIFGSTKPEAKEFKRWVTSEVLPSTRETGGYQPTGGVSVPTTLAQALRLAADQAEALEAAQPAIDFKERVEANAKDISLQGCAKKLELNYREFRKFCLENNILRILDGRPAPTHYSLKMGYIRDRTTFAGFSQAMVTPRGVTWINNKTKHLPRLSPRLELGFLDEGAA